MSTSTVQQIDLYREVHKGLRKALFDVTVKTGNTDYADQQAVPGPDRNHPGRHGTSVGACRT